MKRRLICVRIDKVLVEEMEQIREQTGIPVATQIELRLKGYIIKPISKKSMSFLFIRLDIGYNIEYFKRIAKETGVNLSIQIMMYNKGYFIKKVGT